MVEFLCIRHGQSVANVEKFFAGALDVPLSDLGVLQAKKTAAFVAQKYTVNAIYTSGLSRTIGTIKPLADMLHLPVVADEGLREVYAGDWEQKTFDDIERLFPASYKIWREHIGVAAPDHGETVAQMAQRVWKTVKNIAAQYDGKTVVLATHATPIRSLQCRAMGLPISEMHRVPWVSNASVTHLCLEGDALTLVSVGQDAHLLDLKSVLPANV